ncbi:di-heme-cytochrome C peroxidase [Methylobacterium soli]|uniref:Cytochrome c domain-containing protein n=1 Tax=Methylobacterium soli TaxID=553447 RepID=A0A6L3SNV3_9HYPH|nr:di-heme-cytochrome C peroxidase [Methylobacterium soli]KAB1070168.1 hypothetical protein F6X53_30335 [Methylobacterium soli]GJE43562.1 hypothetical protein AEGHOMDF_2741 [Methylobacterium soli]
MHARKLLIALLLLAASLQTAASAPEDIKFLDQGTAWTDAARSEFYTLDQGARMIPLPWLQALRQGDGSPFLEDGLTRYGYLPNPSSDEGLPVGFTTTGPAGVQIVGMTCSACHTRQITVGGSQYRIDGGPAIVDFQSLLADLDTAVGRVLQDESEFGRFAASALRTAMPDSAEKAALRDRVAAWHLRYHTLMERALPHASPWGFGRLDAVGMIFNRLAGLDLGPPPTFIIKENIRRADAPTRYPFLWNAPVQDRIQWPGFADNGSDVLALARNLGQVLGVFGVFQPKKEGLIINYLNNNSANFGNLQRIEDLIKKIRPPKWPSSIDEVLANQGKAIFERATVSGGCAECHGIRPGTARFLGRQTWATPVQDVGTDTREYDVLAWTAKSGALKGAFIPLVTKPLKETDLIFNILANSVVGTITAYTLTGGDIFFAAPAGTPGGPRDAKGSTVASAPPPQLLPPALRELQGAFNRPSSIAAAGERSSMEAPSPRAAGAPPPMHGAYESRVLEGIWATAPYLHNGSVPTLADLLKPAAERPAEFKIGPAYDLVNIGLAKDQLGLNSTIVTTGCNDRNSGNSRCGHEFGTQLSPSEKKAILEYLKTL